MKRLALFGTLGAALVLNVATVIGAPTVTVSDAVHAPNTGTSCSGQTGAAGVDLRTRVDDLRNPWESAAATAGATLVTVGELTATAGPTNPLTISFPGSSIAATATKMDVTEAEALSTAPGSTGLIDVPETGNPGSSSAANLQDCAPRPQSLYPGSAGGPPLFFNAVGFGDANDGTTRDGVLFTFSQPVRAFGAWFGDLESRPSPDGVPARIKLFDADGNVISNSTIQSTHRVEAGGVRVPIDTDACGGSVTTSDDHLGCGNQATVWVGFADQDVAVAQMLVVVGDDDDDADSGDHQGLTEYLSFIGPSLAEVPANLSIIKTADSTSPSPGDPLTYRVTITNQGDRDASSVTVTDMLPPGFVAASASDPGVIDASQVVWPNMLLPARSSRELVVSGTITQDAVGELTNVAVASSPTLGPTSSEVTVNVEPLPDPSTSLSLTKSAPATARRGGRGIYRIRVTNTGSTPAENVTIVDPLPRGVALVSSPNVELAIARRELARLAKPTRTPRALQNKQLRRALGKVRDAITNRSARMRLTSGVVTWRIASLAAGESRTVTVRVRFTATGRVVNRAVVRADNAQVLRRAAARVRVVAGQSRKPGVAG